MTLPNGKIVPARRVIGNPNPKFIATLGNEFDLGDRLKVSVLFDGRFGNDVANFTRRISELFGVAKVNEREIRGDTVFRTFSLNPAGRSLIYEEYIEDGSYVKLRELAIQSTLGPALVRRLSNDPSASRDAPRPGPNTVV